MVSFEFYNRLNKIFIKGFLIYFKNNKKAKDKVYIYGAGAAGIQLAASILVEGKTEIKGFLDDNKKLWGRSLKGLKIYPPSILEKNKIRINKIFFAISNISKSEKKKLLKKLQKSGVKIFQTPSVSDLTSGRYKIDELRPIEIGDLLGRDVAVPKKDLLAQILKTTQFV